MEAHDDFEPAPHLYNVYFQRDAFFLTPEARKRAVILTEEGRMILPNGKRYRIRFLQGGRDITNLRELERVKPLIVRLAAQILAKGGLDLEEENLWQMTVSQRGGGVEASFSDGGRERLDDDVQDDFQNLNELVKQALAAPQDVPSHPLSTETGRGRPRIQPLLPPTKHQRGRVRQARAKRAYRQGLVPQKAKAYLARGISKKKFLEERRQIFYDYKTVVEDLIAITSNEEGFTRSSAEIIQRINGNEQAIAQEVRIPSPKLVKGMRGVLEERRALRGRGGLQARVAHRLIEDLWNLIRQGKLTPPSSHVGGAVDRRVLLQQRLYEIQQEHGRNEKVCKKAIEEQLYTYFVQVKGESKNRLDTLEKFDKTSRTITNPIKTNMGEYREVLTLVDIWEVERGEVEMMLTDPTLADEDRAFWEERLAKLEGLSEEILFRSSNDRGIYGMAETEDKISNMWKVEVKNKQGERVDRFWRLGAIEDHRDGTRSVYDLQCEIEKASNEEEVKKLRADLKRKQDILLGQAKSVVIEQAKAAGEKILEDMQFGKHNFLVDAGQFLMTQLSVLTAKSDSTELNMLENQQWALSQFDGKTIVFDGWCGVDRDGVIHIPTQVLLNGEPLQLQVVSTTFNSGINFYAQKAEYLAEEKEFNIPDWERTQELAEQYLQWLRGEIQELKRQKEATADPQEQKNIEDDIKAFQKHSKDVKDKVASIQERFELFERDEIYPESPFGLDFLAEIGELYRMMDGEVGTNCKSGKDRTSKEAAYLEGRSLAAYETGISPSHKLPKEEKISFQNAVNVAVHEFDQVGGSLDVTEANAGYAGFRVGDIPLPEWLRKKKRMPRIPLNPSGMSRRLQLKTFYGAILPQSMKKPPIARGQKQSTLNNLRDHNAEVLVA